MVTELKMANLKDKLTRSAGIAGVGLASLIFSGCATFDDEYSRNAMLLGVAGAGLNQASYNLSSDPKRAASAENLSNLSYNLAGQQAAMAAARAGKSDVNVNVNVDNGERNYPAPEMPQYNPAEALQVVPPAAPPQPEQDIQFWICNYWQDFDNDKEMDYPGEFVGLKRSFKKNEQMRFYLYLNGFKGSSLHMRIYGPKGEINTSYLLKLDPTKSVDHSVRLLTIDPEGKDGSEKLTQMLIEQGAGKFKIAIYKEEIFQKVEDFEITE